jgi:hypothetical protein
VDDFFQDGRAFGPPNIALRLAVAFGLPAFDGALQLRHALEAALANHLIGDIAKKRSTKPERRS